MSVTSSASVPASPSCLPVQRQVPVSLSFLTIFPPCPRSRRIPSRRPHQKLYPLPQPYPTLRRSFYHHLYQIGSPTGVRFPLMLSQHRAHTSRRTRRSSTRSDSCGVSTGIHSARWIQRGFAHASSRSTRLGTYSRDASLMCEAAPSLTAVCAGQRSRWAFACGPAWKRSACENMLTTSIRTGGARDVRRDASC